MAPIYYEHSRKNTVSGQMLATLYGVSAAIVGGAIYSFATVYCPIIYVNLLLTLGFGFAIGWAASWGAKIGHVRNQFFPAAMATVAGFVGLYVAWGTDRVARFRIPPNVDILAPYRPDFLWNYIQVFYQHGFWNLNPGHGANQNAQPVNGIVLAIVWTIEAGLIMGTAGFTAWKRMGTFTYCEQCQRWARSRANVQRLSLAASPSSLMQLAGGDLTPLESVPRAKPGEPHYLRLDLTCCDGCQESNYLSIHRITTTRDKKGKVQTQTALLVDRLAIDAADVSRVREAGFVKPPEPDPPATPPDANDGNETPQPDTENYRSTEPGREGKTPWE